ncbi:MAG: hypothetical protein CL910_16480 [Deltaproteobacteria bacterium]|nr:hypothetical protein [Deltaproteobacteria bacterium]
MRHDDSFDFREGFDPNRTRLGGSGFESGISLSGHERNHLFANGEGRFLDVSGVSGLDHPADGRAAAWLDYDRDGWLDFAVVNANAPMLQLFRNRMGDLERPAGAIGLRFVGGNQQPTPSADWSSRDGYGAKIEVTLPGRTLYREYRAGEGFAAQNSDTLLVGLGPHPDATLRIRWPSGREQDLGRVAAGSLVTAYENPADAPDGAGATATAYRIPAERTAPGRAPIRMGASRIDLGESRAALRLYTTMATWCETCRSELPRIAELREAFGPEELALFAVPVDPDDSRAKLESYLTQHRPAYEMLLEIGPADVAEVKATLLRRLRRDPLPASIVTDREGRVLSASLGVPSLSTLRRLLSDRG